MIIFGFRSYLRVLAVLSLVCGNCHNPAAHRVVQVTRKFTLFFIPLFPVSRSRHMTCTFCGVNTRLSKEQADQLVQGAQTGPAPMQQAVSTDPPRPLPPPLNG